MYSPTGPCPQLPRTLLRVRGPQAIQHGRRKGRRQWKSEFQPVSRKKSTFCARRPPGASVFDLSVSVSPPATSEGLGPLRRKQKQTLFCVLEGPYTRRRAPAEAVVALWGLWGPMGPHGAPGPMGPHSPHSSQRRSQVPQGGPRGQGGYFFGFSCRAPAPPFVFCFCFPPPARHLWGAGPNTDREIKNARPRSMKISSRP